MGVSLRRLGGIQLKVVLQRIRSHVGGINGVLMMIYSFFIFFTSAITNDFTLQSLAFSFIIIGFLCFLICPMLLRLISKVDICSLRSIKNYTGTQKICIELSFFIIPLLFFLIQYISYYPGGFTKDSIEQYTQAITNQYNDWHPVFHTLLAFKLPLTLTGGWIGSIVLFQIVVFSAVLAYALHVINKYTDFRYAAVVMGFVLLNPQLEVYVLFPWKDVSFTICTILLVTFSLQIYLTKGEWARRPMNICAFVVAVVCATLFRPNAVLFTLPLTVAVLFCVTKKRGVFICISVLVLFSCIKFPLYSMLDVEKPGQRQVETLGLPMTVIGTVVTYAPDALDEETREFAYRVAPEEVWEEKFQDGIYNYVKWDSRTNNDVIEEYGAGKVLSMMIGCFKRAPLTSLIGLIKLTEGIYSVSDPYSGYMFPSILSNDHGITQGGIESLNGVYRGYALSASQMFPHLFMYLGVMHLVLVVSILAKCSLKKWEDWKRILFVLPVFIYNFGSALLLTGVDDTSRFFLYTFPVTPFLLLFCYKNNERNTDISFKKV